MALGFTGIPLPDLLADIRIANLPVCPERVSWRVRVGWMETGVWFVQITLNPNAQLPVDLCSSISPSLSCWSEPLPSQAAGVPAHSWLLFWTSHQPQSFSARSPATQPLTYTKRPQINACNKIIAFTSNRGCAVPSRSDTPAKPKQSLWQISR